jgi:phosphoribosyl 1,2-cyclic phosphodiesterase
MSGVQHIGTSALEANATHVTGGELPDDRRLALWWGPLGVLQVTFYGVRGSTPCHGDDVARYGGNTSCVSVSVPGQGPVMFDIGTGARYFGASWPVDQPFRGTCLLSHLHWDHTQGLPFFAPLLRAGSEFDVYGPAQEDGRSVEDVFAATIRPPLFPIDLGQLPGEIRFHDTSDADFFIGQARVRSRVIPHVGPTLGYRVEWQGRSVAYLSDHQQPYDGSFSVTPGAMELVEGVDLLIHDSQYTPEEFTRKATWGHCTMDYAVWLAGVAGVKRLALFHHDPLRDDDAVDAACARMAGVGADAGVDVVAAREGLTLTV